ncbi:hypothetical protein INT47_008059 [Mucor saturninus]|uniref:GOLD domain-containing protein n=1 Tax=Mucor saturninus TaxID=64648 RepID=A0A8H7V4Z5_9FUNG|nr:hypothetical protein INT47_008059 [Mucor saturninus]
MFSRHVFLLLVAITFLLKLAVALNIDVPAHQNECFYEELEEGDKMTLTFEVGEGGNLDIDVWLSNPQDAILASSSRESKGAFSIKADKEGRYTYCFSNKMSAVTAKSVNFNAHVMENTDAKGDTVEDPLKKEIEELAESILAVKAEQEYIVSREKKHRDTAESTNSRVKWWSVSQLILLVVVCLWQVHYLKHFFEGKSTV